MPKVYKTIRVSLEVHRKLVKARSGLERKTGERHTFIKTVEKGLDAIILST